jgi:hypothetical protein
VTAHLQATDLLLALKLDNEFVGNLARYFTGLLTADRAALAVQRVGRRDVSAPWSDICHSWRSVIL